MTSYVYALKRLPWYLRLSGGNLYLKLKLWWIVFFTDDIIKELER